MIRKILYFLLRRIYFRPAEKQGAAKNMYPAKEEEEAKDFRRKSTRGVVEKTEKQADPPWYKAMKGFMIIKYFDVVA